MVDGRLKGDEASWVNHEYVSLTRIVFRRRLDVYRARRRWRALLRVFERKDLPVVSWASSRVLGKEVLFVATASEEEFLRNASACDEHIEVVRWTIGRAATLSSMVLYPLGQSSMSRVAPIPGWALRPFIDRPPPTD
jgi:hypothetical protein